MIKLLHTWQADKSIESYVELCIQYIGSIKYSFQYC